MERISLIPLSDYEALEARVRELVEAGKPMYGQLLAEKWSADGAEMKRWTDAVAAVDN